LKRRVTTVSFSIFMRGFCPVTRNHYSLGFLFPGTA
jgi:hypothetical protein